MEQKPTARQVIRAAIAAAGGSPRISEALGIGEGTVSAWTARGSVPARWVQPLCELGGHVVKAEQLLEAMAREGRAARERAAA
jgi:hypothetical protein